MSGALHGDGTANPATSEPAAFAEEELVDVYSGIDTIALHYRNQVGALVVEVLTFRAGRVAVGHATHRRT